MSGDVQPRKRKDKKKKKDDLSLEEPRGTAAALGEGDLFMHSQHDHGTGGHWCAKIIFFSLLAVLVTLIGLIILENRGLTELEANSVESRYSGVLEGWIEDAPDDHHDEHTLELKHPDDEAGEDLHNVEDEDHDDEGHDDEEDEAEESYEDDEDNVDESNEIDGDEEHEEEADDRHEDNKESDEILQDEDDDNEEDEERDSSNQYKFDDEEDDEDLSDDEKGDNDGEDQEEDNEINENRDDDESAEIISQENDNFSNEIVYDKVVYEEASENYENSIEDNQNVSEEDNEVPEDQEEDTQEDDEEEIERIEREVDDNSAEEEDKIYDNISGQEDASKEEVNQEIDDDDQRDFSDEDDDDEPPLERITTPPAGKPFVEIEEEVTEKPVNTLAEEEEYEKRQQELKKKQEEEAQASQMWLKLAVGGALLVATHAVIRRATGPRDAPEPEERAREEPPRAVDHRSTFISEESVPKVEERSPVGQSMRQVEEELFKKPAPVIKAAPVIRQDSEEEIKVKKVIVEEKVPVIDTRDKELYSDEEEVEDEEEEDDVEEPVKEPIQKKTVPVVAQKPNEESEPEDVEIIDDEQIDEEEEEEVEDEEEISDVDDTELLTRLEAKYGRLPEPERPGQKFKDGGNSIEDDWPGEPIEPYWREQLDAAEEDFRQGRWSSCESRASSPAVSGSARARYLAARALDRAAEEKRDNALLGRAITAYLHLLKMNERLSDVKLLEVAQRAIDRIHFRGTYLNAEPIYRLLIRRFPDDVTYRNNLTISFLMANRADLADEVLKETLARWPNDRVALAHRGFVLKNHYNKLQEAVELLYKALEGDAGPANEPRFYYHLGDALLLLARSDEAHKVHERGAALGHFPSASQRSLYNVKGLRSRPWWRVEDTPYENLARELERSWRDILKEGEAARALYEQEKEGLKEKGDWSQLDLFVRGREVGGRCARAPVTCRIVRAEVAATCRRGQVKFSVMAGGTHVRAHVGPTNCRLRMHLGLSNTENTYIRVDKEIRQWQVGKTLLFDDSFEHEVWHNGTGARLVLIVDVWHPDLTAAQRRTLPAI